MRRTMLLLATVGLALLFLGGVAVSEQRQGSTSSASSATDKSEGEVSIQSTTVKASFASGTGANRLSVKVSDHGNLASFESPAGQEAVFGGNEGYVLCTGDGATVHGHDTGSVEGGFGTPTFSQPNGAGTFPLTVTRNTTGGAFELKQVWAKPDATEKDVTVTMTLKNLSSAALSGVTLVRTGDFDVGTSATDRGAATNDSVWQWDDVRATDSPPVGLMLTALTFGTSHAGRMDVQSFWVESGRRNCYGTSDNTPTAEGDYAMRMIYLLGNLSAGQSKTVKFSYGRM